MLDFVNIIYVLTIMLILNKYYHFKNIYFMMMILHLFSIFLFNGFLFDASYMPDQFEYFKIAKDIRNLDYNSVNLNTVGISSVFFALFPIPFINSIYSICIINYLLYLFLFFFLLKNNILNSKFIIYFYLFFPSLLMYSSLSLRDMTIFVIMSLGIHFLLVKQKYVFAFLIFSLLGFIKVQNLLILIFSTFLWIIFTNEIIPKINKIFIYFILGIIFLNYYEYFSIDKINYYRHAFFNENLYDRKDAFVPLHSYFDIFIRIIPDSLNFLLRPFPWNEFGVFQLIQFFENIIVLFVIISILLKEKRYNLYKKKEIIFLNLFLLVGLTIYGLVIFNSGTAVRYKMPFIVIYIIYSLYFINSYKIRNIKCVV